MAYELDFAICDIFMSKKWDNCTFSSISLCTCKVHQLKRHHLIDLVKIYQLMHCESRLGVFVTSQ